MAWLQRRMRLSSPRRRSKNRGPCQGGLIGFFALISGVGRIQYRVIFEHFNCKPLSDAELGSGAKPSYTIRAGETPLAIARAKGHSEVVKLLETRFEEKFPLHAAAKAGDVGTMTELLDGGAEVDAVANGRTALFIACENGKLEAVELLLEHGADIGCLAEVTSAPNDEPASPVTPPGRTRHSSSS